MSTNDSFSSGVSFLPPHPTSSNFSIHICLTYAFSLSIFTAYAVTNIIILCPFHTLILFLGLQRLWQQGSTSSQAATTTSHSDIFTFHMVAMEMITVSGCVVYCWGLRAALQRIIIVGTRLVSVSSSGQICFHMLTCMERYLAVVHPVTYLGLKKKGGVIIRNLLIGCAWLFLFGMFCLTSVASHFETPALFILTFSLTVICFCNFSVLHVLIRPGPGEVVSGQLNQSKKRAFYTITAIMGALLFRVTFQLLVLGLYFSNFLNKTGQCGAVMSGVFFSLPSSMVLPLLFLHRAGKLTCCMKKGGTHHQSRSS